MSQSLIIALGASAGGVQALRQFFEHTPPDAGLAYVVLLHLSPNYDSQLAGVLQQVTSMPVSQVLEKTKVERDHVYVIPPDKHLTIESGHIIPSANVRIEERRAPVDIFFRSLADAHKSNAVGVILSGTGANGSMGLKRIKEEGGAVFVQNPREAEFNEMPRHAIATDLVDEVLNVAEIPERILRYRDTLAGTRIDTAPENRGEQDQRALRDLFTLLRQRTGHDFTNYKRATLMRRIGRRMAVQGLSRLPDYADYANWHPEETQALLKDLLISVTNFFRDKTPFEVLEQEILPVIFQDKTDEDQVRIWVAGCATGEEAYTIAMLCAEQTQLLVSAPKVQVFATDIDEAAIAAARDGFYTLNDAADISPERLASFFIAEEEGYRVRREIRETVLFAYHNFLKDPPFSRIDLISCRNVLIYLNRQAQEQVMETFHFAMQPAGFLLLGTSEGVDTAGDLFKTYNREQHIFQTRQVPTHRSISVPSSTPQLRSAPSTSMSVAAGDQRSVIRSSAGELHLQLIEQYAPPSLVVNANLDIIHMSFRAGRFLRWTAGELSQNLLKLIREELRADVRNGLHQAAQKGAPVTSEAIRVRTEDGYENVHVHVRPLLGSQPDMPGGMLIVFEPAAEDDAPRELLTRSTDESATRHLEDELARLRMQLRASSEQHEFQAEELKAGNEELQAMNEELRSATEELETSKEELQSINEELSTVNQELKVRVEESSMVSSNLRNLINSTDIGTIFLDRSLRVALFTPAVRSTFNLIPADYGRPLSDINGKLRYDGLQDDALQVLERLQTIEREADTTDGRILLTRLSPYRTEDDRIQGVVISLVDITALKQAERALQTAAAWRKLIMESAEGYAIFSIDLERRVNSWNIGAQHLLGYQEQEILGKSGDLIFTPEDREKDDPANEAAQAIAEGRAVNERWHLRKDGSRFWGSGLTHPVRDDKGVHIGFVKIMRDLTEQRAVEEAIRANEARQTYLVTLGDALRPLTDPIQLSETATQIIGRQLQAGRVFYCEMDADGDHMWVRRNYLNGVESQEGYYRISDFGPFLLTEYNAGHTVVVNDVHKDPRITDEARAAFIPIHVTAFVCVPLISDGRLASVLAVNQPEPREWTRDEIALIEETAQRTWAAIERTRAEEARRASEQRLLRMVNVPRVGVLTFDADGSLINANDAFLDMVGYTRDELKEDVFGRRHIRSSEAGLPDEQRGALQDGPFEKEFIRKDGTHIWMMFVAADLGDGTSVEYVVDISERVNMEQALRESEEHLRITTENAIDYAIITMSPERIITGWSRGAERSFGYTEAEMLGKPIDIIFTPEDLEAGAPQWEAETARDEGMAPDERWHVRKNGERFYMSGVLRPIYNGDVISGYVKVARDMTRQKEADEALRISEERYRAALQSAEMAAWDWDVTADCIIWNDQHFAILGLTPQPGDLNSAFFMSFIHRDDLAPVTAALQTAVAETGVYRAEFRIVRADNGETRWMSGYGSAVTWVDGQVARMVGVMYDITRRKRVEEQKEEFIGIASHELKTPLTSIKAYSQILHSMFKEAGDQQSATLMGKMESQINRLTNLVRALLDVTRIREGKLELQREPFRLDELIAELADEMQPTTPIRLEIVETLPVTVNADRKTISQVVTNLLSNAIKYARGSRSVDLRIQSGDGEVVVSVRDYGIGMSKETSGHVFERFFRAMNAAASTYPGLGLGLYISAEIVRLHGGRIWVESKEGKGSTFYFSLPSNR